MAGWIWVVIVLAVLVCVAVAVWTVASQRRTRRLQDRFGPEYARTASEAGSRREAEAELAAREERHDDARCPSALSRCSTTLCIEVGRRSGGVRRRPGGGRRACRRARERGDERTGLSNGGLRAARRRCVRRSSGRGRELQGCSPDRGRNGQRRGVDRRGAQGYAALPSAVRRLALRSRGARHRVARHIGHGTGRSFTMNDRSQGLTTADIAGSGSSDDTERTDLDERDTGRAEDETNRRDQPAQRAVARADRIEEVQRRVAGGAEPVRRRAA